MSKTLLAAIAGCFLILCAASFAIYHSKKAPDSITLTDGGAGTPATLAPKADCMAGVDEICPTADWYRDYQKLMALNAKYKIPQDQQDYINGLLARLRQAIPQGYDWNEDKRKFVKKPVAPPPVVKK